MPPDPVRKIIHIRSLEDTRFPRAHGLQFLPKNYNHDIRSLQTSVTISRLDIEVGPISEWLRGFADGQAAC
jgi:hypothetical protein